MTDFLSRLSLSLSFMLLASLPFFLSVYSNPIRMTQGLSDNSISTTIGIDIDPQSHSGEAEMEIFLEESDKYGPLWVSAIPQDETFSIGLTIVQNQNDTSPVFACNGTAFVFCQVSLEWMKTLPENSKGNSKFYIKVSCQSSTDADSCLVKVTLMTGVSKLLEATDIQKGLSSNSQINVHLNKHYPTFVDVFVPNDPSIDRINVISFMDSAFEAYEMVGFNNGPGDLNSPDWISGPLKNLRFMPITSSSPSFKRNQNYTVGLYPFETLDLMLLAFSYGKLTFFNRTFYDAVAQNEVNYYSIEVCGSSEPCRENQSLVISVFPFSGSPNLYVSYGDQPTSLSQFLFFTDSNLNDAIKISASDRAKARNSQSFGEFYYLAVEEKNNMGGISTYMVEWSSSDVIFLVDGVRIGGVAESNSIEHFLFKKKEEDVAYSISAVSMTGHIQVFLKECSGEIDQNWCKIYDHEVENPNEYESQGNTYFVSSQFGTFHNFQIPSNCQVHKTCSYAIGIWTNQTTNYTICAYPLDKPYLLTESQLDTEELSQSQSVYFDIEVHVSQGKQQRLTILIVTFYGENKVRVIRTGFNDTRETFAPNVVYHDDGTGRITQLRNITLDEGDGAFYSVQVLAETHTQVGVEYLLEETKGEEKATMIRESLLYPGVLNSSHPYAYYSIPYEVQSASEPLTIYLNKLFGFISVSYGNNTLPEYSNATHGTNSFDYDMKKIHLSEGDWPAKGVLYVLLQLTHVDYEREPRELEGLGDESAQKRRSQEINGEEYDQTSQYSLSYSIGTLRMEIEDSIPFYGYTDSNETQYFYMPIVSETLGVEIDIRSGVELICQLNIGPKVSVPGRDSSIFYKNFTKSLAIEPYQVSGACNGDYDECWLTLEVLNPKDINQVSYYLLVATRNLIVLEEGKPVELSVPKLFFSATYLIFKVKNPTASVSLTLSSGVAPELILVARVYDYELTSMNDLPTNRDFEYSFYNQSEYNIEISRDDFEECSQKECYVVFVVINHGDRTPEDDAFRVVVSNSNKVTSLMFGAPFQGTVAQGASEYFEVEDTGVSCDLEFILTPMDGGDASIYVNRGRESFPNVESGLWDYHSSNDGPDFIVIPNEGATGIQFFTIAVYGEEDSSKEGQDVSFYVSVSCQNEKTINVLTPGERLPVILEKDQESHFAYLNSEQNTPYLVFHWDFAQNPVQIYFKIVHPSVSGAVDWRESLYPMLPNQENCDLETFSRDSSAISGNWVYVYKGDASDRDMEAGTVYLLTMMANQTAQGSMWVKNPEHPLVLSPGYPYVDYLFSKQPSLYQFNPDSGSIESESYFLQISLVYNHSAQIDVYLSEFLTVSPDDYQMSFSSNNTRNNEDPNLFGFEFSVDWHTICILVVANKTVPVTISIGSKSSSTMFIYPERTYDTMLLGSESRKYKVALQTKSQWEVTVASKSGFSPSVSVYLKGKDGSSLLVSQKNNDGIQIPESESFLIEKASGETNSLEEYEILFKNENLKEGLYFHFLVQKTTNDENENKTDLNIIDVSYNEVIERSLNEGERNFLSVYTGTDGFIVLSVSHCIGSFKVVLANSVEDIAKGKTTLKNYKTFNSWIFNTVWLVQIKAGESLFVSIEATRTQAIEELGINGAVYQFKANYFQEDIYDILLDFHLSSNSVTPWERVEKSKGNLEVEFDQVDLSEDYWKALNSLQSLTARLEYKIIVASSLELLQLTAGCPTIGETLISSNNLGDSYSSYSCRTNLGIREENTKPTFELEVPLKDIEKGVFTVIGSLSLTNFQYPFFYEIEEVPNGHLVLPAWLYVVAASLLALVIVLSGIACVFRRKYQIVKGKLDFEMNDVMRQASIPTPVLPESPPVSTKSKYSSFVDDKC